MKWQRRGADLNLTDARSVADFLHRFATKLMGGKHIGVGCFKNTLRRAGFNLLQVIDVGETQGFICKREVNGEEPYLVLAFRGTEKKVSDWLTDIRCLPHVEGDTKVHTGFWEALTQEMDSCGRTVEVLITKFLETDAAKDGNGEQLPLFITGHSLGGALALLATVRVAPDISGACYTFGAPRVANYEYFRKVKTPVYRVVNSSDIVPRVPPGAVVLVLVSMLRTLRWVTGFVPGIAVVVDRLESFLDKLNGYRHVGDLRYLTDVAAGRFSAVRLLSNPPLIDRLMWAWRRIAGSVGAPVKDHGMEIYCRKLAEVARTRQGGNHGGQMLKPSSGGWA